GSQTLGDGDMDMDGFVDDYSCASNPFYYQVTLTPGDFLTNNNFPLQCLDLGDLPDQYNVLIADDGARHAVLQTPAIYMGSSVDIEPDGQPDMDGGEKGAGDDGPDTLNDDEDVFAVDPIFVITVPTTMEIPVVNTTSSTVTVYAFLDMNANGSMDDAGEMVKTTVAPGYTGIAELTFTPPITATVGVDVGLRLRISTDSALTSDGFAEDGEVEDYVVLIAGFDYGDLPESYNTSGMDSPPAAIVDAKLMLGGSVDAELDGLPGEGGEGDDKDPGLVTFGTSNPAGDDESGVDLITPMVPGNTATFRVNAINNRDSAAVLQAWVDFDGNGSFESDEQLTTGSFATQGATVPVGGLTDAELSFTVPSDAKYYKGKAMTRFRLSRKGGLSGSSDAGTPLFGEVEDYAFELSKVSNVVWEDYNNDGIQDDGEPGSGLDGNFAAGRYDFRGLIAGKYKIVFTTPEHMLPTKPNEGLQVSGGIVDSDMSIVGNIMDLRMVMEEILIDCETCLPKYENGTGDNTPETNGFPDNQADDTHDAGFWRPCCSQLLKYCCPQAPK
ncbi:MAG: GEVED domain-containing protein, partial [Saprospiraceae bacterium]|nr:GEVED domain-containing protein [Saprospiraceae bacterium]